METSQISQNLSYIQFLFQLDNYSDIINEISAWIHLNPVLDHKIWAYYLKSYKCLVSQRRNSMRIILQSIEIESKNRNMELVGRLSALADNIFKELHDYANDLIHNLNDILIPSSRDNPGMQLCYIKAMADFYRYIIEFSPEKEKANLIKQDENLYENALEIAGKKFPVQNDEYMGLALNYSVFLHDIKNDLNSALEYNQKIMNEIRPFYLEGKTTCNFEIFFQMFQDNFTIWSQEKKQSKPQKNISSQNKS